MEKSTENPQEIVNSLYEKLVLLNEGLDFKDEHSQEWKLIFIELTDFAEKFCEEKWDAYTLRFKKERYFEEVYYPFNYANVCSRLLKFYCPGTIVPSKDNKGDFEITFWNYFIDGLYQELCRYATDIKTALLNSKRVYKISVRTQKKINKLVHYYKNYCKYNPKNYIAFDSNEMVEEYIKANIFPENEIKELLEINRNSFMFEKHKENTEDSEEEESNKVRNIEEVKDDRQQVDNYVVAKLEIESLISCYFGLCFEFIDDCFVKFLNRKKQENKNNFLQQIITYFYLEVLTRRLPGVEVQIIIDYMKDKNFFSPFIKDEFLKKQELIKNYNDLGTLKSFERRTPPTLEWITHQNNKKLKNKNYGNRRKNAFLKFLQNTFENTDFEDENVHYFLKEIVYLDINQKPKSENKCIMKSDNNQV